MNTMFESTTMLKNTRTDVQVEAEVDNVKNESFVAYLAQQKIYMKWNGRTYVGNAHGMEFTSDGPKEIKTIKGRF